ncbi:MAG: DUF4236 domain-containing protein [Pirellulales bacterium]|nr:DUF4236 domain-containing protein [Pirellulales bacterium]
MGYYLRKSFRIGPVRFNLSKSGIGVSAGVKGARFGVRPDGRSYVHAGRYGLYFRQELGRNRRASPSGRPQPKPQDVASHIPPLAPTKVYDST